MFGTPYFIQKTGGWSPVGYLRTNRLYLPTGVTVGKGTWMAEDASTKEMQYASGVQIGYMTQDMTLEGQGSLQAFKDRAIGKKDIPATKGQAITLRVPNAGSEIEVEGLGEAGVGNLLVTSGTGSISTGTARKTELSTIMGSTRVAQSGDIVMGLVLDANLTPYTAGNVRIRYQVCAPYKKA